LKEDKGKRTSQPKTSVAKFSDQWWNIIINHFKACKKMFLLLQTRQIVD